MPKLESQGKYFHENKSRVTAAVQVIKMIRDIFLSPSVKKKSMNWPAKKQIRVTIRMWIREDIFNEPI